MSWVKNGHGAKNKHKAKIGPIKLYRLTHYGDDKGWSDYECQQIYDRVIAIHSQPPPEDSEPLTEEQICKQVLGTRPGYVREQGHGKVPPFVIFIKPLLD
uniref:Uncharacterized protein n=1 Tax=Davidia involucrata TaxID=16924 RepID=A0A5B6ZKV6_DAVIN